MDEIISHLQGQGLSEKSAKLYVALLQLGSASVQELSRKTSIIRTTCYPLIEELEKGGLVSTTKSGKRTIYVATSPSAFVAREEQRLAAAHMLVPTLNHILSGNQKRPVFEVYEGIDGVWRAYADVIRGRDYTVKSFIPADDAIAIAGKKKIHEYIRERVSKNISVRAIMQDTPLIQSDYGTYNKHELRTARFVDPKNFPMPVEVSLYPDHNVAITSFIDNVGIIIRSRSIHKALDTMFELSWLSGGKK